MITPLEQVIGYGIVLVLLILLGLILAVAGLCWVERDR